MEATSGDVEDVANVDDALPLVAELDPELATDLGEGETSAAHRSGSSSSAVSSSPTRLERVAGGGGAASSPTVSPLRGDTATRLGESPPPLPLETLTVSSPCRGLDTVSVSSS